MFSLGTCRCVERMNLECGEATAKSGVWVYSSVQYGEHEQQGLVTVRINNWFTGTSGPKLLPGGYHSSDQMKWKDKK